MTPLTRFGVSLDHRLLRRFDQMIAARGYGNRSEAIRDLIRSALVEEQWARGREPIVGTVTLVYDHHMRDLPDRLNELQHTRHDAVISTLHVHLDRHNCLEVIVVRGKAKEVKELADELIGTKGVKHGKLTATTTGKKIR